MEHFIYEVDQTLLSYLINADDTGLDQDQKILCDEWVSGQLDGAQSVDFMVPDHNQDGFLNEPVFSRCDATGLDSDVIEVVAIVRG